MVNINDCGWCLNEIRGETSSLYGLCSKCRNTKEGKKYIKNLHIEQDNSLIGTRTLIPTYDEFKRGKTLEHF